MFTKTALRGGFSGTTKQQVGRLLPLNIQCGINPQLCNPNLSQGSKKTCFFILMITRIHCRYIRDWYSVAQLGQTHAMRQLSWCLSPGTPDVDCAVGGVSLKALRCLYFLVSCKMSEPPILCAADVNSSFHVCLCAWQRRCFSLLLDIHTLLCFRGRWWGRGMDSYTTTTLVSTAEPRNESKTHMMIEGREIEKNDIRKGLKGVDGSVDGHRPDLSLIMNKPCG